VYNSDVADAISKNVVDLQDDNSVATSAAGGGGYSSQSSLLHVY
jgi:hypothetical protein